jgi:hypothetical protein
VDLVRGAEDSEGFGTALAGQDAIIEPEQVVDGTEDFGLVIDD